MSARVLTLTAVLALAPVLVPATLPTAKAQAPRPTCQGVPATIVGTEGDDRLRGTPGDDVIVGLGGTDIISGRAGDDLICGGDGQDELRGGPGDDRLHGERDRYYNFRGSRYVLPDILDGGAGDDLLDGGLDDRRIHFGTFGVLDYSSATAAVTVDLAAGTATGQGTDTIVPLAVPACSSDCFGYAVYGSPEGDTLLGSEDGDYLIGMAGDDTIEGRGGVDQLRGEDESGRGPADADSISGGDGDDLIVTNRGSDLLTGDDGDDTLWSTGGGPSRAYGGSGDDRVVVQLAAEPGFVLDGGEGDDIAQLAGPEGRPGGGGRPAAALVTMATGEVTANGILWGTIAGLDNLHLGSNVAWEYHGTDVPETLRSSGTSLVAFLHGGDDSVFGTDGDDTIDGGEGHDKARGDRGDDVCVDVEVTWSCAASSR